MMLVWENFTVDESIYFPKFRIDDHFSSNTCGLAHERRSCIRGVLKLSRKVSFYFTRFYAPTLLITTATFISYWMPARDIAPRTVINMTPFLTLVTLHNALNNEINVSYVVALHIWFFACMFYAGMGLVVLFFAMQFHAAEVKRQAEEERKRVMEENDNLFRKLGRCMSTGSPDEAVVIDKVPDRREGRRRSSIMGIEAAAWLNKKTPASIRTRFKRAVLWSRGRAKKLVKRLSGAQQANEYVNPADRVARILAPTTFATFAIAYFAIFYNYAEEHVGESTW